MVKRNYFNTANFAFIVFFLGFGYIGIIFGGSILISSWATDRMSENEIEFLKQLEYELNFSFEEKTFENIENRSGGISQMFAVGIILLLAGAGWLTLWLFISKGDRKTIDIENKKKIRLMKKEIEELESEEKEKKEKNEFFDFRKKWRIEDLKYIIQKGSTLSFASNTFTIIFSVIMAVSLIFVSGSEQVLTSKDDTVIIIISNTLDVEEKSKVTTLIEQILYNVFFQYMQYVFSGTFFVILGITFFVSKLFERRNNGNANAISKMFVLLGICGFIIWVGIFIALIGFSEPPSIPEMELSNPIEMTEEE